MENEEHLLLYDSGRGPLVLRLPVAIVGIILLSFGARAISFDLFGYDLGIHQTAELGSAVPVFLSLLGLALLFLAAWFRRQRIYFDAHRGDIIVRLSTPFREHVRRVSLSEATGIYREFCHGWRAETYWNIGIAFRDHGQCPLASACDRYEDFAGILSEKIQLPILEITN
ncbi:MAG TPA: hypothetical protein VNV43_02755 [Candidatus Acidoferrales bacterium]|nr:hypothetical protein [Candidatus Acidoferrales bacterium]